MPPDEVEGRPGDHTETAYQKTSHHQATSAPDSNVAPTQQGRGVLDPSPSKRRFRQIHRPGHPGEGFPANHEFLGDFCDDSTSVFLRL